VRLTQLALIFARPEHFPSLDRDPVRLGKIGSGPDAVDLKKLMEALGAAMEPKDSRSRAIHIRHGEHLAALLAVADPVHKMMTPVQSLRDMGQRQAKLPYVLIVHRAQCMPVP